MQISSIQNNYLYNPQVKDSAFKSRGKPITLQYIVEKRSYLLPERILGSAKKLLADTKAKLPSLLDLHKQTYAPLLECKTLSEAQDLFPEFNEIEENITFKRPKSIYAKLFKERTENENFALKMLQDIWAKLKTKDEIAEEFGMYGRTSLDWALKQINFVTFNTNYRKLLQASDEEGNKIIAQKTTAWNSLHPDLMYAHNKKAAQKCKTDEYRTEQAKRMKEYDLTHPERRKKISITLKEGWEKCPEVRAAISEFIKSEKALIKNLLSKKSKKIQLSEFEKRALSSFYKRFWESHPELKDVYAKARKGCKASLDELD